MFWLVASIGGVVLGGGWWCSSLVLVVFLPGGCHRWSGPRWWLVAGGVLPGAGGAPWCLVVFLPGGFHR